MTLGIFERGGLGGRVTVRTRMVISLFIQYYKLTEGDIKQQAVKEINKQLIDWRKVSEKRDAFFEGKVADIESLKIISSREVVDNYMDTVVVEAEVDFITPKFAPVLFNRVHLLAFKTGSSFITKDNEFVVYSDRMKAAIAEGQYGMFPYLAEIMPLHLMWQPEEDMTLEEIANAHYNKFTGKPARFDVQKELKSAGGSSALMAGVL